MLSKGNKVTEKGRKNAQLQCNNCSQQELDELTDVEIEKAFIEYMQNFKNDFQIGIKVFKGVLNTDSGNYVWTKIID